MSFERVVVSFLLEIEHPFQINLVCSIKMFRIHKNSERNSVIGSFHLRTNNSGRYNRFGYLCETQYGHDVTDVHRVSDGGYLQ